MKNINTLRGMTTVSFWAEDVAAAAQWYADLLGIEPYFVRPNAQQPEYVEFRLGDYQHELGIISSKYAPHDVDVTGGVTLYWHVDDIDAMLERVMKMGATAHEPHTERGEGFVTAAVIDPFGNILGLMHNPHYLSVVAGRKS